jgi:hypothetical protein
MSNSCGSMNFNGKQSQKSRVAVLTYQLSLKTKLVEQFIMTSTEKNSNSQIDANARKHS